MSSFVNRKGTNLNKKILNVESVVRDESGEITSMEVEVVRNDSEGLEVSGTPLNASNLTNIVKSMIDKEIDDVMQTISTLDNNIQGLINEKIANVQNLLIQKIEAIPLADWQKVIMDKNSLQIKPVISTELELPQVGEKGSLITWEVTGGDAITISNNTAVVNRRTNSYLTEIQATLTCGEETTTKVFEVLVIGTQCCTPTYYETNLQQHPGMLNTLSFNIESTCNKPIHIEFVNLESDYLIPTIINNDTNNVTISVVEKEELNNRVGSNYLLLVYSAQVYLASDHDVLLADILCMFNYYYDPYL